MSFDVTSRSTGGANLIPGFRRTVIVRPSAEICGSPWAMSGRGLALSPAA
jgi:hypothetical protein